MTVVDRQAPVRRRSGADAPAPGRPRSWRRYGWAGVVLAVGAVVTAGLVILAVALNAANERHLLALRVREVGSALTGALPGIETPLGAAAALGDVTHGNAAKFRQFAAPYVKGGKPFVSLSLWRVGDTARGPMVVAGAAPSLQPGTPGASAFLSRAATGQGLSVIGLMQTAHPRLGYGYSGSRPGPYIAYGEAMLPAHGFTRLPYGSAYSNLNVALYLGRSTRRANLLLATVRHLPLTGRRQQDVVPFGDTVLTVVVTSREALGGALPARLPWGIGVLGALLTLAATGLTVRLIGDRYRAQTLAAENRRLYAEQRGIAQALQHALLPDVLPRLDGIALAARYEAGVEGIDIGGDWYDLIVLNDERLLLVVGDVSGRGLKAATAMASLRFAIHYAAQDDPPELFLPKLSAMRRLRASGLLATVLCAVIDLRCQEVSVTSAGHLPMLMVADGHSEFLQTEVGLPIGIDADARYTATTFAVPDGATLLGFTDGLVERRGEVLDTGLERLRTAAAGAGGPLEEMMTRVLDEVRGPGSVDDTAMAAVRWMS